MVTLAADFDTDCKSTAYDECAQNLVPTFSQPPSGSNSYFKPGEDKKLLKMDVWILVYNNKHKSQ